MAARRSTLLHRMIAPGAGEFAICWLVTRELTTAFGTFIRHYASNSDTIILKSWLTRILLCITCTSSVLDYFLLDDHLGWKLHDATWLTWAGPKLRQLSAQSLIIVVFPVIIIIDHNCLYFGEEPRVCGKRFILTSRAYVHAHHFYSVVPLFRIPRFTSTPITIIMCLTEQKFALHLR